MSLNRKLDQQRTAMVIGAAVQHGKPIPDGFINQPTQALA